MSEVKLILLENSYSFLVEGLSKAMAAETKHDQWKFAIFNLVQATELLLKERLQREHPQFIYSNIDKPKLTVGLLLAVDRLKNVVNLELTEKDEKAISKAASLRNQIVHHEFSFSIPAAKSSFARILGFYRQFLQRELKIDVTDIIDPALWNEAIGISEYVDELCKRAVQRLGDEAIDDEWVWPCLDCGFDFFVVQDDYNRCYLCGGEEEVVRCGQCQSLFYRASTDWNIGEEPCCEECYFEVMRGEEYNQELYEYLNPDSVE